MPGGWSEGRPELVGGHVAVDLVNTVSWRLDSDRRVDRLVDFPTFLHWAGYVGLVDESSAAVIRSAASEAAEAAVDAVRTLREHLHATLAATATAQEPSAKDLAAIQNEFARAVRRATPDSTLPLRWTIAPRTPDQLVHLLALCVVDLLRSTEVVRVRQCEGSGCGWLFLDRTRNHSRRWCDTGDCGNRERVRRHYTRHKPGSSAD